MNSTMTRRQFSSLALGIAASPALANFAFAGDAPKKVVFMVNGNLGDKSYFDLGAEGLKQLEAKYGAGVQTKVIEMGPDQSKWQPSFEDVSDQDWDLIIGSTFDLSDTIAAVAPTYPDKKYVLIDGVVDYSTGDLGNVYCVTFKQNEGSYLAGLLAAGLIEDGTVKPDQGAALGFLGGVDIPVIKDFLVGYVGGAPPGNPAIKIAVSYAGSFDDAAKGKELALAQYRSGTAIGFNVAGLTGLGQLAAAKDTGKWAIGVNSDQEAIFRGSDPAMADRVATSMLKRVDVTIMRTFALLLEDAVPVGKIESIGLAENAVGLAEEGNFAKLASPDLKKKIDEAKAGIIRGSLKLDTAFGMDQAALDRLRAEIRP